MQVMLHHDRSRGAKQNKMASRPMQFLQNPESAVLTYMGVGRIFSRGGNSGFFPGGKKDCLQGGVDFALHAQHEMSYDSGIQLIKDFNYFESKSRKRPRSLSMVSLNSNDWEEYWNAKVIPRNGLTSKRIKLEQCND